MELVIKASSVHTKLSRYVHGAYTIYHIMEKRMLLWKDAGALMQQRFVLVSVLALSFILMDPLDMRPVGPDFKPVKNDIAQYREVMAGWPWDKKSRLRLGNLESKDKIYGPESLEFDPLGRGPYAGLADGRIVRWMGEDEGWETFAVVTPYWSEEECANGVNSTTHRQWRYEAKCGRPLGLRFDSRGGSGNLYIADAYHGLLMVGPEGGIASPVAIHVDRKPILFANDLDIHSNGSIFFTDTSNRYNRVEHFLIMIEGEATGRLLRYDIPTKTTHVVLKNLAFPNGVQLSKDESFVLYTETTNCRVMKYILKGPKSGTTEVVANLPGFPDNIRMNENGEFWVAIDCCRTAAQEVLIQHPWLRRSYFRLPVRMRYLARIVGMRMYAMIARLDETGKILDVLADKKGDVMKLVSEVRETEGKLWIGTVAHNHIGIVPYPTPL